MTLVRWHLWMPVSDGRARCPAGHVFRPRAGRDGRGWFVVRCPLCTARLVLLLPRGSTLKLVAEASEADVSALRALDDLQELVYLLTTPVASNPQSAVELR